MKYTTFAAASLVASVAATDCSVSDADKLDCGYSGIDQSGCESKGCCWSPAGEGSSTPWCFHDSSYDSICFAMPSAPLTQAPFSDAEIQKMKGYFMANINIQGSGGVVAAPDYNTPGGSYYYHWERDGALTMRALQDITSDPTTIIDNLKAYTKWVMKVSSQSDPNGINVLTEPKYNLPDGSAYTGGWCRPQNDGPGLRAISLIMAAQTLEAHGESDFVNQFLWGSNGGIIKTNLDYITGGYTSSTCDLWEEVRSEDFFWNRVTQKKALLLGAEYASAKGDSSAAQGYTDLAKTISAALDSHWNGSFILESTGREKDGAVIVGFNAGFHESDGAYAPTSLQVASTVKVYNEAFCSEYTINQADTKNGVPGVMYGRYPGDSYAGGNPWVLTTAALGQLLYRAASYTLDNGGPSDDARKVWATALGVSESTVVGASDKDLAQLFFNAGDGVMLRLREHVQGDDFHLAEQIDRNTGAQKSANDLTWSYGEMLSALAKREQYSAQVEALFNDVEIEEVEAVFSLRGRQ